MLEIEAKIKVNSHEPIRRKLMAIEAQRLQLAKQDNIFFDRPDRSLLAGNRGLRLRLETSDRNPAQTALFTWKGPPHDNSPLRPRESFDLNVTPTPDAIRFLLALGYIRTFSFEKRRETWLHADCHIELDELPHLGLFVEIEGPSEAAITPVRDQLGLGQHELVHESYATMMARYVDEHKIENRTVVFAV